MKKGQPLLLGAVAMLWAGTLSAASEPEFAREEVGKHASKADCWIIIDQVVYDISSTLKDHLRYGYELGPWCGKEATQAWQTKGGRNKPHSRKAQLMLKALRKGRLKAS